MKTKLIALAAIASAVFLSGCASQSPANQDVACIYGKLYVGGSPYPLLTREGNTVECSLEKTARADRYGNCISGVAMRAADQRVPVVPMAFRRPTEC